MKKTIIILVFCGAVFCLAKDMSFTGYIKGVRGCSPDEFVKCTRTADDQQPDDTFECEKRCQAFKIHF